MKYTPQYFDFNGLEHKAQIFQGFLTVMIVYIVIFSAAWVYNRLGR